MGLNGVAEKAPPTARVSHIVPNLLQGGSVTADLLWVFLGLQVRLRIRGTDRPPSADFHPRAECVFELLRMIGGAELQSAGRFRPVMLSILLHGYPLVVALLR